MTVRVINGDCRSILPTLDADSFDCIVTSPPYWGLRDYGCDGQIGFEPTLQGYLDMLVGVARELRRVLKPGGTFWLNIGDCYAGSYGNQGRKDERGTQRPINGPMMQAVSDDRYPDQRGTGSLAKTPGLKPKDLCMVPHRLAIALQDDGWWVRGDQVWAKSNGMPESTRDRPSRAHEYVFLLTKSEQYYFGYDDVKLPPVPESVSRLARAMLASVDGGEAGFVVSGGGYAPPGQPPHKGARSTDKQRGHSRRHAGFNDRWDAMERAEQQSQGSALRSVWWIAPSGYTGAHFATMPVELASVCILAGCPPGGSVLDPFGGAGTTGLVADRLGRNATLIELNPAYRDMAANRVFDDAPLFSQAAE